MLLSSRQFISISNKGEANMDHQEVLELLERLKVLQHEFLNKEHSVSDNNDETSLVVHRSMMTLGTGFESAIEILETLE